MCPYYLDGDSGPEGPGDLAVDVWPTHAVFKVRRGRNREDFPAGLSKLNSTRHARARRPDSVDMSRGAVPAIRPDGRLRLGAP